MTFRSFRRFAALNVAVLALGAAACSDTVTDPASSSLKAAGPHLTIATSSVTVATINPTVDNYYQSVEGHRLIIPANSICNPLTSGYGAAYWNSPCQTATSPITFTITTTTDTAGASRVTVSPDVRFSPAKTVMVYLKDAKGASTSGAFIAYCNLLGCVNEGATDASMTTYRDATQGYIYRRIKHFSGYNVVFGYACDPAAGDPNCVDDGTGGVTSKAAPMPFGVFSGYITTVGLTNSQD